jgi:hypothetical protein
MSFDKDQTEMRLPVNNEKDQRSFNLLPKYFRTEFNKKFLSSTLDQMITPGVVEKINAFAGRRWAKAATADDNYLTDVSEDRENYQLEPSVVYKDELGNVEFLKDYNDFIGQIKNFKGSVKNHSILNSQEFYTWDPHIDWDKFTNYREYYWLPFGPDPIPVAGQARSVISTYTVTLEDDGDNFAYVFTPDGITKNPSLKLFRGQTYRFEVNTPGHPIAIAISRQFLDTDPGFGINITNLSTLYKEGVTADSDYIENGVIEFTVPDNAPDILYYISKNDVNTSGKFVVLDITENTDINVEEEILGKKTYKTSNGFELSNGMKVFFQGNVTPKVYSLGNWYVEGVGDAIKLVAETDLEIPAIFTSNVEVPFDNDGFDRLPFENATSFAGTKDYIVINRVSADRNPWSRYNRWFHKSVIEQSSMINGQTPSLDQTARATRPIIEFEAGLKLFNHGWKAKSNVNLVDDFTQDVLSTVEGSYGYNVDNVDIVEGMRILFTADTDTRVNGKIYEVKFIIHNGVRQVALIETEDSDPLDGETVLITDGSTYKGKMFFYENGKWKKSQEKTSVNQTPLFDLFDNNEKKFNDEIQYPSSSFTGNKVFSYRLGTSAVDPELGFSLSYRNISNIGDIVFDFNLLSDVYSFQSDNQITVNFNSDIGYLKKYDYRGVSFTYVNGWVKADKKSEQAVIRTYPVKEEFGEYFVDVFDSSSTLQDLRVLVYVNGNRKKINEDYRIENASNLSYVVFNNPLTIGDIVLLKCYSSAEKNDNGYYEIPYNLERNPLNENLTSFTLGQVYDHVDSIVENLNNFRGNYPGQSNLRDLGPVTKFGRRFLQHTGPLNLSLFHMTDKSSNIVKSIRYNKQEYTKFKRQFLKEIEGIGFDGPVKEHVDKALEIINSDKVKSQPFYFSDMLGYESSTKTVHNINGSTTKFFALSKIFNLDKLSIQSVNVYVNGLQMLYGKDYIFTDSFVEVLLPLTDGDTVEIYEYESTNGSFIPPTPTKLGLYPKFEPQIIVDDTLLEPKSLIQGHDGSLTLAFNDYRDDLILELEKRIYNNIKVDYESCLFSIYDLIGGKHRNTGISKDKIDTIIIRDFTQWLELVNTPDYTSHNFWDKDLPFTYNYDSMADRQGIQLKGYWRNVYKNFYDTDRPHTHPWEMLGFSIKPYWWNSVYGPAPYTSNNTILWNDLSEGIIRVPNTPVIRDNRFARPGLLQIIPVDEEGKLIDPLSSGLAQNFVLTQSKKEFIFGDQTPIETSWRRTSEYPYALMVAWVLLNPSLAFSLGFDVSRIERDITGAIVYSETNKRVTTSDLVFPSLSLADELVLTSGLVNFISNYMASYKITGDINKNYNDYKEKLKGINNQLAIKLGGFADKSKIKLVLDSRSPLNKGNVFVPEENYSIVLNTSSPLDTVVYSGIMIEKVENGFIVSGYDKEDPIFNYNKPIISGSDPAVTVGGISESFVSWDTNKVYVVNKIVEYQNVYYRTKITHTSTDSFDTEKFVKLAALPIVGGASAFIRTKFEESTSTMPYGTFFRNIQDVVDFMLGYEKYNNTVGFKLEFFNKETNNLEDMTLCVKEFLFWVTQNWDIGTILSVSPIANKALFERQYFTVDDIYDDFYEYSILAGDSKRLSREFVNVFRDTSNQFGVRPVDTDLGLYLIKLPLVQKEHVVLIDNITVFNDVIFDKVLGYRQDRLKLVGYRTADWSGGLNIPGFFYDEAKIRLWQPWTDYTVSDLVKYKEFYYSSNVKHTSTDFFDANQWNILLEKPESELLTNWDYRTNQISDFYDLDSDNFDTEQQRLSQHLIGYQKRDYLANIINDDVSQYKFYQGFIQDKGSLNSLTKLFDALNSSDVDSLEFYEEWAVRVGNYGAVSNITEIELLLDESKFRQEPQNIELVSTLSNNRLDLVYEMLPTDVYLKPENYNNKPFPITENTETYTKDRGYVRDQDVDFVVDSIEDILNLDIDQVELGKYLWILNYNNTWDVWRHVDTEFNVVDFKAVSDKFTITLDKFNTFNVGDIIGLNAFNPRINGFYKVISVGLKTITFESLVIRATDIENFDESTIRSLSTFVSRRFSNFEDINDKFYKIKKMPGEKIWVDNYDSKWAALENKDIYQLFYEIEGEKSTDTSFAKSFDVNQFNTVMVVGIPNDTSDIEDFDITGSIKVYKRFSEISEWKLLQNLKPIATLGSDSKYGASVTISNNARYIAVGAPNANDVYIKQGAVYFFVKDQFERYRLQKLVLSETASDQEFFGHKVQFRTGANSVKLFVSVPGSFKIDVYDIVDDEIEYLTTINSPSMTATEFGADFDINEYGDLLVTHLTAPTTKSVLVYRMSNNGWTLSQELTSSDSLEDFANSYAVSVDGTYIAIGAPKNDLENTDNGCVYVYKQAEDSFELNQVIRSPFADYNEMFGSSVDFSDNKLVISSKNGDLTYDTTFDESKTIFDNLATTFVDKTEDVGKIYVYQQIQDKFIYSEDLTRLPLVGTDFDSVEQNIYSFINKLKFNSINNFKVIKNKIYLSISDAVNNSNNVGVIMEFSSAINSNSWNVLTRQDLRVDLNKIKRCFLYNKDKNVLISNLDFIDPRQGKIAGPAEKEISFKTFYDPAIYSNNEGNQEEVNVDQVNAWTDENVGRLWWNLTSSSWYNSYQGSTLYRSTWWNKLTFNSNVTVCEWVETTYTPSEWRRLTETNEGISKGITGLPLYDNTYTSKKVFDPISNNFSNKYYYWVVNKRTIPNVNNRALSSFEVSKLIEAPEQLGYKFVTFLSDSSVSLYNVKNLIEDKNVVLHFTLVNDEENENNIHFEYQLLTEGVETSIPSSVVEQKWIDSLVGYDLNNLPVPDNSLSVKEKYGILNTPRQGMFVNRFEALKQLIERANNVLIKNQIVDKLATSALFNRDELPKINTGKFDEIVDTRDQLDFISVSKVEQAILTPVIKDGRIVSVNIINPGRGYKSKPLVEVNTVTGIGAIFDVKLDNIGKIIEVNVKKSGKNYASSDSVFVRKFSVLVKNDALIKNRWSIVEWDKSSRSWSVTDNERFNTTNYWNYVDWYATGYSNLSVIKYTIDQSYQLFALDDNIGDLVKINNVGSGEWLLLEKINNLKTEDYSLNYKTVGRQNGTVQISKDLYDYAFKISGYDATIYDTQLYDSEPVDEARNILLALKKDIFVDELAVEWNKLFFASVRYALSEQNFVDWIFKTSFIRAKHNVGLLSQKVTFQNDNLESYEEYVKEAKPYATKIREYVSNYFAEDNTRSLITDFDLQPSYDDTEKSIEVSSATTSNGTIENLNPKYEEYPYKSWLDNVGFELISIEVVDGGAGYLQTPKVIISGVQNSTAKAYLSKGSVSKIEIVNVGGKYLKTPSVTIEGNISDNGTPARAVAILGNSNVRSSKIGIKFDRVIGDFEYSNLLETEAFVGTGAQQTFKLKWPVDVRKGNYKVYVNDLEILPTEYSVGNVVDFSKGYTRRIGFIKFVIDPATDDQIVIEYKKDVGLLTASDRIKFFYNPTQGMPGNDLSQLMDGVDYTGVKLDSIDFGSEQGWDSAGWGSLPWDTFSNASDDIILVLDGSTSVLELPKALEVGIEYNVYLNNIRIDDPNFGLSLPVENPNAVIKTILGNNQTSIDITDVNVITDSGDVVVIRKTTSDGSFIPVETAYDVALTGGTFNNSQLVGALGINSGEIIVDGDGFVTPTTSRGPEELIPGQVLDTLDITVYNRPSSGAGIISSNSYVVGNEDADEFYFDTLPQSKDALIAKVNNVILSPNSYNIDYSSQTITLSQPINNSKVNVIAVGTNGIEINDVGVFSYQGGVTEILTNAVWTSESTAFVSRNGLVLTNGIEFSLARDTASNRLKITFTSLVVNDTINYAVYPTEIKNYSQMLVDNTFQSGNGNVYHKFDNILNPIPFNRNPIATNILVKAGNRILSPGYSIRYTIDPAREYAIERWQFDDLSDVKLHELMVFVNGVQLSILDYIFDKINSQIILVNESVIVEGSDLEIFIISDAEYYFLDTEIVFNTNMETVLDTAATFVINHQGVDYTFVAESADENVVVVRSYSNDFISAVQDGASVVINSENTVNIESVRCINSSNLTFRNPPQSTDEVKIYQFSNHDVNDFKRYTYDVITKTSFGLTATDERKRNLLSVGTIVLDNPAPSTNYVWVIKNGELLSPEVDYILENSITIKLINKVEHLDTIDILQFGNYPVVLPFGYRLFKDILNRTHYKRLNNSNSYKLAQPLNYYDIRIVLDDSTGIAIPNKQRNIPGVVFIDGERIEYFEIKGNSLHQLRRGTLGTGIKSIYEVDTKVLGQGIEETIAYSDEVVTETFVSNGKEYTLNFTPNSVDEIEVFVAGNKLRKTNLKTYNTSIAQDSPDGDVEVDKEFSVLGNTLILTNEPPTGVKVNVARKVGKLWSQDSMSYSDNSIARFLRSTTIDLPK